MYFLVPRNVSDYVKCKALWDCKGREKSRPDPFPSCLRLSRTSTRDRERLVAEQHEASFFTFVGNYDKCIANEARNTSLLYLLEVF